MSTQFSQESSDDTNLDIETILREIAALPPCSGETPSKQQHRGDAVATSSSSSSCTPRPAHAAETVAAPIRPTGNDASSASSCSKNATDVASLMSSTSSPALKTFMNAFYQSTGSAKNNNSSQQQPLGAFVVSASDHTTSTASSNAPRGVSRGVSYAATSQQQHVDPQATVDNNSVGPLLFGYHHPASSSSSASSFSAGSNFQQQQSSFNNNTPMRAPTTPTTTSTSLNASAPPFVVTNVGLAHHHQQQQVSHATTAPNLPPVPMDVLEPLMTSHQVVTVQNLEARTTQQQLYQIFFPLGAVSAVIFPPGANSSGGSTRRSGAALFDIDKVMLAKMAAEKFHDFVPHGQSQPLVVRYIAPSASTSSPPQSNQQQPDTAAAPADAPSAATATAVPSSGIAVERDMSLLTTGATLTGLLQALHTKLSNWCTLLPQASDISSAVEAILRHPECSATAVEDTVRVLEKEIRSMGPHAAVITTPLAAALKLLFATPLPPRGGDWRAVFHDRLARKFVPMLVDDSCPKEGRVAAAVACSAMFELGLISGAPFGLAKKMLQKNEEDIIRMNAILQRKAARTAADESSAPTAAAEPQDDEQLIVRMTNLIEVAQALVRAWTLSNSSSSSSSASASTPEETEYQQYLNTVVLPQGGSSVRKTTPPVTPSARPTPPQSTRQSVGGGISPPQPLKKSAGNLQSGGEGPASMNTSLDSNAGLSSSASATTQQHHPASAPGTPPGLQPVAAMRSPMMIPPMTRLSSSGYPVDPAAGAPVWNSMVTDPTSAGAENVLLTLQKDLLACTVYLTKLPGTLSEAKVRRLLFSFGDVNKIRMYKERHQPQLGSSSLSLSASRGGSVASGGGANQQRGSFGFAEFSQPATAKAMIDYFRNCSSSASPFFFLRGHSPVSEAFTEEELAQLLHSRASYARSAIHDQDHRDAIFEAVAPQSAAFTANGSGDPAAAAMMPPQVKVRRCTFGLPQSAENDTPPAAPMMHFHPSMMLPAMTPSLVFSAAGSAEPRIFSGNTAANHNRTIGTASSSIYGGPAQQVDPVEPSRRRFIPHQTQ